MLQRQADDLERKIGRVRNVMTRMDHPEAMAPTLVELTENKRDVDARMAAVASQGELREEKFAGWCYRSR